jgi:hypothetical protein
MSTNNEPAQGNPDEPAAGRSADAGGFTEEQLAELEVRFGKKRSWRGRVGASTLNAKDAVQGLVMNATPPDPDNYDTDTFTGRLGFWLSGSVWRRIGIGAAVIAAAGIWCAVVLVR